MRLIDMLSQDGIDRLWQRYLQIPRQLRLAFWGALAFTMIAFNYAIANTLNHDDEYLITQQALANDFTWLITELSRFSQYLLRNILFKNSGLVSALDVPLGILMNVLCGVMVCVLWRIRQAPAVFFITVFFAAFPSFSEAYVFNGIAIVQNGSFLLVVLALWCFQRQGHLLFLAGAVILAFVGGLYQSVFLIAVPVLAGQWLFDLLEAETINWRTVFGSKYLRSIAGLAAGLALYFVVLKLFLLALGLSQTQVNRIHNVRLIPSAEQFAENVRMMKGWIWECIRMNYIRAIPHLACVGFLLLAFGGLLLDPASNLKRRLGRAALLAFAIGISVLGLFGPYLIGLWLPFRSLGPCGIIYGLLFYAAYRYVPRFRILPVLIAVLLSAGFWAYSAKYLTNFQHQNVADLAYANRIIAALEQAPEFPTLLEGKLKLAVVGGNGEAEVAPYQLSAFRSHPSSVARSAIIKYLLNGKYDYTAAPDMRRLAQDLQDRPVWPDRASIFVYEGYLVVHL